ncbi:hypothetical protein D3C85_1646000 [compost metagenome]
MEIFHDLLRAVRLPVFGITVPEQHLQMLSAGLFSQLLIHRSIRRTENRDRAGNQLLQ